MIEKLKNKLSNIYRNYSKREKEYSFMIIYYKKYKAAYFPIPKVANSSLLATSVEILKSELPEEYYNLDWKPGLFRNQEYIKYLEKEKILLTKNEFYEIKPSTFAYSFVRNPWDRISSCYHNKIMMEPENNKHFVDGVFKGFVRYNAFFAGMSFKEFVEEISKIPDNISDIHIKSQHKFITNNKNKLIVDYVGKFENLEEDFNYVKKKLNYPENVSVPHLLKSDNDDYREMYDEETKKLVAKRYERDITMFSYEF